MDASGPHLQGDDRVRPAAEVDRRHRERLVHRHHEIAGAIDAAPVAEGLRDRLAERDAEILDSVMLIDIEIAARIDAQVEPPVPREELEHVIEKPDARTHAVPPLALEGDRERDAGFLRPAIDYRAAHSTSSIASMQPRVCSTIPVVMRTQPSQPGSVERSRR